MGGANRPVWCVPFCSVLVVVCFCVTYFSFFVFFGVFCVPPSNKPLVGSGVGSSFKIVFWVLSPPRNPTGVWVGLGWLRCSLGVEPPNTHYPNRFWGLLCLGFYRGFSRLLCERVGVVGLDPPQHSGGGRHPTVVGSTMVVWGVRWGGVCVVCKHRLL